MIRLADLFAKRPAATKAVGARFYATDTEKIYFSTGTEWVPKTSLDESDINGQVSGANLAARPAANNYVGYVWTDEETGNQYEAFPGAWALIGDLTPDVAPPRWVKHVVTLAQFIAGSLTTDNKLAVKLFDSTDYDVVTAVACNAAIPFAGPDVDVLELYCGINDPANLGYQGGLIAGALSLDAADPFTLNTFFGPLTVQTALLGRAVWAFLSIPGATGAEDYEVLTAGSVNIWLLRSTLPSV